MALVGVVLVAVVGLAVALLAGGEPAPTADEAEAPATADEPADEGTAGQGATGDDATAAPPADDGDLAPEVAAAHRELFTAIDASEREMIALSQSTPIATGDLDEQALADFEAQAADHVAELERIRGQLEELDTAGSDDVATIRDAYVTHLQDWIDWGTAVGSDPTLVDRPEASGPYFDAINFSADGFATTVERELDRDAAPGDVVSLADEILQRGFSADDGGTEI